MFLRRGDYLKFLMGLRKISTKICAQLHVFFAVETNLSFWWDLESFGKKMWPVTHFFRSADFLKFLMGLGKFRQKGVTSYTFFAVETILSVWGDLESFDKKMWPVTRFFAVETNLSFWGLWKVSTKRSAQLHVFFAVETNLSFWWGLEKFPEKNLCPATRFFRCGDKLEFLVGLGKIFTKKCAQSHVSSLWRLS